VGQKQLLVEIKVSHGIDENKLNKIKLKDIPLLEIDLSHLKNEINKKALTRELYPGNHSLQCKMQSFRWIHNPKYDKLKLAEQEKSQRIFNFLNQNRRNIKLYGRNKEIFNCPLMPKTGGPYKFVETCEFCNYNLGKTEYRDNSHETLNKHTDRAVVCIGHKKYELEMLFNECGAIAAK
jgi:hypothetical protein